MTTPISKLNYISNNRVTRMLSCELRGNKLYLNMSSFKRSNTKRGWTHETILWALACDEFSELVLTAIN